MIVKRSQIYHKFIEKDFVLGDINGYQAPLSASDGDNAIESQTQLALCDLTALARAGYKGVDLIFWCETQHAISCPTINQMIKTEQGFLLARLSHSEIVILQDVGDKPNAVKAIMDSAEVEAVQKEFPGMYYLPRQDSHHYFMLCGEDCSTLFAKLCAVDLRTDKFQSMRVAQTTLARASVIIMRRDISDVPGYLVLVDSSLAEYLWECLLDAMQEFSGTVVGYNSLI